MSDKAEFEIIIDRNERTYRAHDRLEDTDQEPRPLPAGEMPWRFEVGPDPRVASRLVVTAMDGRQAAFDPAHATACSVIALDWWITDKVFETDDDTIYCVRVVNTSTHYLAEDICVDIEIDPTCEAVRHLLPDEHSLIEIRPPHQCIKCLAPRHYVDLKFVAIARGPRPGVFPVHACVTYDLVYWTRAHARTHARLEIEVHDDCRPRRDPCKPPRRIPPDPGDYRPAPQPECRHELFMPCGQAEESSPPADAPDLEVAGGCEQVEPAPSPEIGAESEQAELSQSNNEPDATSDATSEAPDEPTKQPETATDPQFVDDEQEEINSVDEDIDDAEPRDTDEMKGTETMSNGKHDHDSDHHHHHQPPRKKGDDDSPGRDRKGCAPSCSNADEMMPIKEDCRLPEGGILEFSYTFRKGFIYRSNKGGRCVYGKNASNGKIECRMETRDDTILVMDVTNHSHFHLKHVRIHNIRIFQNHEEVTMLLPDGHPVAQIVPDAAYIGLLPRGESKWVAMSFITRGIAPGCYTVKFCVDYDIESCTVSAGINVEISCD